MDYVDPDDDSAFASDGGSGSTDGGSTGGGMLGEIGGDDVSDNVSPPEVEQQPMRIQLPGRLLNHVHPITVLSSLLTIQHSISSAQEEIFHSGKNGIHHRIH